MKAKTGNLLTVLTAAIVFLAAVLGTASVRASGHSLSFGGSGTGDTDRVKIPLEGRPVNVGQDFTLEFFVKASASDNTGVATAASDGWITGNIVFDRDVFGGGDNGDFGLSLSAGRIAFGVGRGAAANTIIGATSVANGAWHHVAVTRRAGSGLMRIYVDGNLDGEGTGPAGDVSYRAGRSTAHPTSDPFLVIGAEKHDAGSQYPSFRGLIDEVRLSSIVRYVRAFQAPRVPFRPDRFTALLLHLDEGNGNVVHDSAGVTGAPGNGERKPNALGFPQWSTDVPFNFGAPTIGLKAIGTAQYPADIVPAYDGLGWIYVAGQDGRIHLFSKRAAYGQVVLDLTSKVTFSPNSEQGLLGIAFDPADRNTTYLYANYTRSTDGATVVSRFPRINSASLAVAFDRALEQVLITIPQPFTNHNGGKIAFGPDGYLYIGMGDGGSGNDPNNVAQNLGSLLGKMLRIDVRPAGAYAVPPDNPYLNDGNAATLPEIWASGLRNPWRFSFDRLTGDLFIGDVGQDVREEVDFLPAGAPGGANFGWSVLEGVRCTGLTRNPPAPACSDARFTAPILDYPHTDAQGQSVGRSISGGYRYRGSRHPGLAGYYLYADYITGRIWAARIGSNGAWTTSQVLQMGANWSTFGEDDAGEIYVADRSSGTIYRIVGGDADQDGLPDWWENAYFGSSTAADPNADTDGDGFTNLQEYANGTDPLSPSSRLKRPDFNGDGHADILWYNQQTGTVVQWYVVNGEYVGSGSLGVLPPATGWRPRVLADVNGDGRTDLVWRNVSGSLTGTTVAWLLDGDRALAGSGGVVSPSPAYDNPPFVADFGRDGSADWLWGTPINCAPIWTITEGVQSGSTAVADSCQSPGSGWQLVGTGDFNGDGRPDVVWRNTLTGAVSIWLLEGNNALGHFLRRPESGTVGFAGAEWTLAGIGDVNGDGRADLIWRRTDGWVNIWLMSGVTRLPASGAVAQAGLAWQIVAVEDFDGDGKADILWQSSAGAHLLWSLNGTTITGSPPLPGVDLAAGWTIVRP